MRFLVLADIHSNAAALDAVLADARTRGFERVLLLGDLVGYGAQPNEVLDAIAALPVAAAVRGNHDRVVAGLDDAESFNEAARQGADWTRRALTPDHATTVRDLAPGPLAVNDWIEICHGTPFDEDAYVLETLDALVALRTTRHPLCLFGHTHLPQAYSYGSNEMRHHELSDGVVLRLEPGRAYLANVGSVGQPRDSDPRAAYGIADDAAKTVTVFRVSYDIASAQRAIREAGLPERLANRLSVGR
ncbi:MAG: metallophosphoesterase family protein [Acidobacteriota bacterium]